jgi:putative ABC transport system substrate-binding protein
VRAQKGARQYRIGVLQLGSQANLKRSDQAFLDGLRDRGYAVGTNLIADFRYGDGFERLPALTDELIAIKPDLLVGTEITGFVMKKKTSTIPIVLLTSADPVAAGLVKSLARPETNVTGMSFSMFALVAKQVEFLTEIVPGMSRVALLTGTFNPGKDSPYFGRPDDWELAARRAAAAKGLTLVLVRADNSDNLREAFAALKSQRADGLVVATNALVTRMHSEVIAEIRRLGVPAISGYAAFASAGGLLSYGGHYLESYRYAAKFVDLILKGAKPSDLPVEQISKYELLVNQKAARGLGLKVPQSILLRADRVIE